MFDAMSIETRTYMLKTKPFSYSRCPFFSFLRVLLQGCAPRCYYSKIEGLNVKEEDIVRIRTGDRSIKSFVFDCAVEIYQMHSIIVILFMVL
jgi:hypothetical protein